MLAFSGRELPDGPFRAYTTRTITDRQVLASEIEDVRERGYAQAAGEREPGLTAIAAPIRSARGELEAIVALQGPSSRFDADAVDGRASAPPRARGRRSRASSAGSARGRSADAAATIPVRNAAAARLRRARESLAESAHAVAQLVRPADRETAPEPGEDRRHPVERSDPHPQHCRTVLVDELRERRRNASGGFVDRKLEKDLDLPSPRNTGERRAHVGDGVESFRRIDGGLRDRPHAADAVDPERAKVVAQVIVRCEVPAPRVDDEAVRAELAPCLLSREGTVRPPDPATTPNDVCEEKHGVAAHRCARRRGAT